MEKLILKSFRIEESSLMMIDSIAKKHDYMTRSRIVNAILHAILQCSNDSVLWKIISSYEPEKSGYTVDFRVDSEKIKNLPHVD